MSAFQRIFVLLSGQRRAQRKGLPALLRKNRFMPFFLCLGIEQGPFPVRFAVIPELQRVSADKDLRWAHKAAQRLLVILQKPQIRRVRRIAGHQQTGRGRGLQQGVSRL